MTSPLFQCQHLVKRYGTTIHMCPGLTAPDAGQSRAFGPRDALAIKALLGVVSQLDRRDPDLSWAENLLV